MALVLLEHPWGGCLWGLFFGHPVQRCFSARYEPTQVWSCAQEVEEVLHSKCEGVYESVRESSHVQQRGLRVQQPTLEFRFTVSEHVDRPSGPAPGLPARAYQRPLLVVFEAKEIGRCVFQYRETPK